MEEEYIFDEHEPTLQDHQFTWLQNEHVTYPLSNRRKETIQHPGSHKAMKARSSRTPCRSQQRNNHEVPQDWQPTKVRGEDNSCQSTGAEHEDVSCLGMIDCILSHTPNTTHNSSDTFLISCAARPKFEIQGEGPNSRSLWYQRHSARGASIIRQERCHANDDQHDMFLRPTPIQRVIWIVAWLWDQDCVAVGRELESFDEFLVGHEGDIDNVPFSFSDLVEVGLVNGSVELGCGGCLLSVGDRRHRCERRGEMLQRELCSRTALET
jgi:hypothetical protein